MTERDHSASSDEVIAAEVVAEGIDSGSSEDIVDAELVVEVLDADLTPVAEVAVQPEDLGLDLPDDPDEAIARLLGEVAATRSDADAYLDDLRRVAADFDNFRKRSAREHTDQVARASQRVVGSLLPVLDSFDSAFTHEAQTPTEEKLISGIRGTYNQLMDILAKEGLEPVDALGEPFDPEVHEAVSSIATGDGALVVATELRRGYRLRGRVLRPALVTVEDHA